MQTLQGEIRPSCPSLFGWHHYQDEYDYVLSIDKAVSELNAVFVWCCTAGLREGGRSVKFILSKIKIRGLTLPASDQPPAAPQLPGF